MTDECNLEHIQMHFMIQFLQFDSNKQPNALQQEP